MKLSGAHLVSLFSVLTAATLVALLSLRLPVDMLPDVFGAVRRERRSGHELLLTEVHDLYRIHTVEYIYRSVFPYDYMPPQISLSSILRSIRSGSGHISEILSDEEQLYLDAYNISLDAGLRTDAAAAEFVVVTVVVRAGFDLSDTVYARPHLATPEQTAAVFSVEEQAATATTPAVRTALMVTPPALVTELRVEDVDPQRYPYPDIALDPAGWRRIAEFVRQQALSRTIADGLLLSAEQNSHRLLRELLLQAGYNEVELRTGIVPHLRPLSD